MMSSQLQNLCESLASSSHQTIWLDKHVTAVSDKCFFQLRQLRRVSRLLDYASVATLVHAFVTSRVDYCNCLLAGATKASLDKLQHVMNAAARVISDTHKFDRGLTSIRCNDLHWLDVPERVTFRLCIMVSVYTTWHRHTCLNYAGRPATSKGAVNCTQRLVVILTSQDVDFQHTADGPSPALAQQHGTLYAIV